MAWLVADLFKMSADELGELEHRDLLFAEQGAQLVICINIATVLGILQVVFFDVVPDFLGDFGAWDCLGTDDGS